MQIYTKSPIETEGLEFRRDFLCKNPGVSRKAHCPIILAKSNRIG